MSDGMDALLLQALAAAGGSGPPLTTDDLLSQAGAGDPTLSLVLSAMMQRSASQSGPEEEEPWPGEGGLAIEPSPSERRLLRNLERLGDELHQLQARNDALATALGACYLCFGDDAVCEVCAGKGRPGRFEPDRELFGHYVVPAVRRLRHRSGHPPNPAANGDVPRDEGEAQ